MEYMCKNCKHEIKQLNGEWYHYLAILVMKYQKQCKLGMHLKCFCTIPEPFGDTMRGTNGGKT